MTGPAAVLPPAAIDACCLIDLLASGEVEAILRASGFSWYLPLAVQGEVRYRRQHDLARPGNTVTVAADLTGLIASGLITACQPASSQELDKFTRYAALFRSDGEAMCLALAELRGWAVATDDRRALRVARQAGLMVVSCPQLVKSWADNTAQDRGVVTRVLQDIELLAHFRPNPTIPEHQWWLDQLAQAGS